MKPPYRIVKELLSKLGLGRQNPQVLGSLISFPKSGRTWLRVMLDRLNFPMHYWHAGSGYNSSIHIKKLSASDAGILGERTLFLHRDPRDTAVSGFFQKTVRIDSGYSLPMGDFIRDPHLGVEKIVIFNLMWLEYGLVARNFKAIAYEELRANPVQGLTLIAEYLSPGTWVNGEIIEKIVHESSFQRMRAQEESGELAKKYGSRFASASEDNPDGYKVRRGKIGGYVDYFSAEDIQWCDQLLARHDYFNRVRELSSRVGLRMERP